LKLPLFGQLIRKSLIARFCRTLGTLLQSGVNLVDALQILGNATGNSFLDQEIQRVTRSVSRGKPLHQQLQQTQLFPELIIHMIMVGEETGELDQMLIHAAEYYEVELDATLESVSSILEPVLIVLIGLVLGGILVAMYLPMFDLVNVVG
jgi:type IV pilus assembly protein PilC